MKGAPRAGTKMRRIYDVLAEFPGVKCSTAEVAAEVDLSSYHAGSLLRALWKGRRISKSGEGRGVNTTVRWWVDA